MQHTAAEFLKERVMLEHVRCSVVKEQADPCAERANRDKWHPVKINFLVPYTAVK